MELSKVTVYKINTENSIAVLCINNKDMETNIKNTMSFTIAQKKIKFSDINVTKLVYNPVC